MPTLAWHDGVLLLSCVTSLVGLCWVCQSPIAEPTEAEAAQETMVRLTFVYWMVYCLAHWASQLCDGSPHPVACSLRLMTLFAFLLTFCCVFSLPLHWIEQRHRQPN